MLIAKFKAGIVRLTATKKANKLLLAIEVLK